MSAQEIEVKYLLLEGFSKHFKYWAQTNAPQFKEFKSDPFFSLPTDSRERDQELHFGNIKNQIVNKELPFKDIESCITEAMIVQDILQIYPISNVPLRIRISRKAYIYFDMPFDKESSYHISPLEYETLIKYPQEKDLNLSGYVPPPPNGLWKSDEVIIPMEQDSDSARNSIASILRNSYSSFLFKRRYTFYFNGKLGLPRKKFEIDVIPLEHSHMPFIYLLEIEFDNQEQALSFTKQANDKDKPFFGLFFNDYWGNRKAGRQPFYKNNAEMAREICRNKNVKITIGNALAECFERKDELLDLTLAYKQFFDIVGK